MNGTKNSEKEREREKSRRVENCNGCVIDHEASHAMAGHFCFLCERVRAFVSSPLSRPRVLLQCEPPVMMKAYFEAANTHTQSYSHT